MAFTTHDNAPYLYRRSGGGGDKEIDKLVGGTIAWNQQMIISTTGNREMLGLTITNNHDGSLSIVGTATSGAFNYWLWGGYGLATELFTVVENHKYFTKGVILFGNTSVLLDGDKKISDTFGNISKATRSASVTGVRMANQTPNVTYNLKVYPMVCDLTLMFGSTIADYVYSLEQSSQGSGLAWLRSYGFFTEDYYDYNAGELKSVSNLVSHDMTGEDASTTLHSYPLGDVTLRGLPKLNGNALYYDGDTYESDGQVTRKYGILTLNGTETWSYENGVFQQGNKRANSSYPQMISGRYVGVQSYALTISTDKCISSTATVLRIHDSAFTDVALFKASLASNPLTVVYELATPTTETADTYTNPQWVDPNGTERYTLSANAFPMPVGHETTYNTDMGSKTVNTQVNLSMTEPQVRQVYAKEGDTARVLNIHLDQTEEDGTLRILRPDGTEVTADAVLVPDFYDGLMAEIPSDATSVVGKCYCDVEQNGVSSMPFTLNVKKNERAT